MKQNLFANPLDELFNIDDTGEGIEDQYMQVNQNQLATTAPDSTEKDPEDVANDKKIDEVYDLALSAYKQQTAMVEIIDPKFAARNAEVAANFLNIALNAATSKAKIKTDRKRVGMFNPAANANKTTNNVIVASQEDILKMIDSDTYRKD
jgi:hypothetical protein